MANKENDYNEKKGYNGSAATTPGDDSTFDNSTVQFVNGSKASEALIDIEVDPCSKPKEEFVGLRKEELMKFASDPYWVKVRVVLLVIFGVAWLAMLSAAIAIIVVAPKCPPRPQRHWWQTAVMYEISPRSFFDESGNGEGDLEGIHRKLDYLKSQLHVGAIVLGPIYPSPDKDFGYDIYDHKRVCPHYGTIAHFDSLKVSMHKKGLKLIMDFIPNHTSKDHRWFIASLNVSDSVYSDYYVWNKGRTDETGNRQPPNNWLSVRGGSAWTWNDEREAYYYHSFSADEPDLNLTNPRVVEELDEALKFWLSKGADGFRFKGVEHLVESSDLQNEKQSGVAGDSADDYTSLEHDHTTFQPESYELVTHWRQLLDEYSHSDGKSKSQFYPRVLLVQVDGSANQTAEFTRYHGENGAHLPTNMALVDGLKNGCGSQCVLNLVKSWTDVATEQEGDDIWSNWQTGNSDASRVATRMGDSGYVNAINLLVMTLPGTAFTYYGEELGMEDLELDNSTEAFERVLQRSPMQWSDGNAAGFSTNDSVKSWIPVAENYDANNVEAQCAHGSGVGHVNVYADIVELRNEPSFQWGAFHQQVSNDVYFFTRQAIGFDGFLVALNFGPRPATVNYHASSPAGTVPKEVTVAASTNNFVGPGRSDAFKVGTKVNIKSVFLLPTEGVVFRWTQDDLRDE